MSGFGNNRWEEKKLCGCFFESTAKNSALSFTRAMQFNYGRIVDKNESFETDQAKDIYAKYSLVKKGDIVINGLNLNYDVVSQRVAIVPKDGIITSAYIVLRPRLGTFSEYFCYLFKAMDSRKIFHGMGTGIRLTLSFKELKNMPIPLPPLPEQKAIVAYLDAETGRIDKAIAAEEKMIALLQERREIVINEAVGGGMDFNAETQRRRGWEIVPLKSCFESSFSGLWGDDPKENLETAICYRVADFNYATGGISDAKLTMRGYRTQDIARRLVKKGDLLMEKSGGGEMSPVGRVVLVDKDYTATCSNFIQQLRCREGCNSAYICYVFRSLYSRKINGYFYNQTTGIQNLKISEYLGCKIPLPPFAEQEEIVKRLDAETGKIDRAIEVKGRQIELLRERRQIVIDEAVTGKVKVA